jgi:putative phosphotransacetylase
MKHKILVETSARHVHLTEEHFKILFGEDATLTFKKELSQPGQFAAEERVTIVGPRKTQPNVAILGPYRKATQVELSATDARSLGFEIVIRESGDIKDTPGCKIVGPKGEIEINEGVIVAKRHIHLDPKTADEMGLKDKQVVQVEIETDNRSLIFGDVVIRVRDDFAPAMHIDTDEANAGGITPNSYGYILK